MKTFDVNGKKITLSDQLLADYKGTMFYHITQSEVKGYFNALAEQYQTDNEYSKALEDFIYEDLSHYNTFAGRGIIPTQILNEED